MFGAHAEVYVCVCVCVCVCTRAHVCVCCRFNGVRFFATLWTVAYQVPLSKGFSRQVYWSGLPCPPPVYLSDSGIKPASPVSPTLQADSLSTEPPGKPSC